MGAEGGFSAQEITQAIERGFIPWQIGERVLRTETAPVVALSSLLTLHQTLTLAQE
ncbi:MAG: RsmE family RNA methyltransferase [Gammaproteobacteria bacterium]|nr:RsmE family RNA methyltransferase [Gammaproteobacteria bacterium]